MARFKRSTGDMLHRSAAGFVLAVSSLSRSRELTDVDRIGPIPGGPIWLVFEGFVHRDASQHHDLPEDGLDAIEALVRRGDLLDVASTLHGGFACLVAAPRAHWFTFWSDRLGARSGVYAHGDDLVAAASRADLLARIWPHARAVNSAYAASMFGVRNGPPPGHCAFRGLSRLQPGERIEMCGGVLEKCRLPFSWSDLGARSPGEWIAEFGTRFERAVQGCIFPSEKSCIMLSGGLDSGPVAAVAASRLRNSHETLGAVSWELPGFPECDEGRDVSHVSAFLDIPLFQFDADEMLPLGKLDDRFSQPDTPDFNPYREAILRCYEIASRQGYRVIFNGNVGDNLYPEFSALMGDQIRRLQLVQVVRWLAFGFRWHGASIFRRFPPLRPALRRLILGRDLRVSEPPCWLTDEGRRHYVPEDWPPEANEHPFPRFARRLLGTALAGGAAAENTITARYGLERRDPFINPDLVELFLNMPFSMSFREGTTKWVMREALKGRNRLPENIRTKGRTGLLQDYLKAGIKSNGTTLKRFLWHDRPEWQQWLRPEPVHNALNDPEATDRERALMHIAVGYGLWLKQIEQF